MPELPEVQITVTALAAQLTGQRLRAVEVRDRRLRLRPATLTGRRIQQIWRRAKYIVLDLDNGHHLLVHLRMTGWFEFARPKIYRAALHTSAGSAYFTDSRRFGEMSLLTTAALQHRFASLGPEPLVNGCDLSRLRRTRRPIKVALLDQRLLAGIGNIYANEALWRARLRPSRPAHRLTHLELHRLRRGLVAALRKGIAYGPRIFEAQTFAVYNRAGFPCPRCRTPIRRRVIAQRSTYDCPHCQS